MAVPQLSTYVWESVRVLASIFQGEFVFFFLLNACVTLHTPSAVRFCDKETKDSPNLGRVIVKGTHVLAGDGILARLVEYCYCYHHHHHHSLIDSSWTLYFESWPLLLHLSSSLFCISLPFYSDLALAFSLRVPSPLVWLK